MQFLEQFEIRQQVFVVCSDTHAVTSFLLNNRNNIRLLQGQSHRYGTVVQDEFALVFRKTYILYLRLYL